MDQLIGVVNKLHETFAHVKAKINLPQIAVVGSQSSGKSSVLEAIVGKDFLPRGSGIVTRCPLVLQLVQLPQSNKEEWGEFLHKPDEKFTDFHKINEEILNRTAEIAGSTSITNTPINLKVFSRRFLNLTLVDLPGLVTNAVGDQPKDIDRQIKEMVTQYVSPENTIILAVSPANADIATSASLQIAKEIDPEGLRTVGVLTKLDLMDRGTDAVDVLTGKLLPLRHGFVGVVNRSQQDINENKGMKAARDDEKAFLNSQPAYSAIADRHGTAYLAKKLNQLLLVHIKAVIPDLKAQFDKMIGETRLKMEKLGVFDEVSASDNLLHFVRLFSDAMNASIDGCETDKADKLVGGALLDFIFHECYAKKLDRLRAADELKDDYVHVNARNMNGVHATLLPSDKAFVNFSKKQILRLKEPSLDCVTRIHDELVKIVESCALQMDRFPKLRQAVTNTCRDMLQGYLTSTENHVRTIISAECSFINVKHPRMETMAYDALKQICSAMDEIGKTPNAIQKVNGHSTLENQMEAYEKSTNDAIRKMVERYFSIVKENVADQVPKAIYLLMISKLRGDVYGKLVKKLYSGGDLETLMTERPETIEERKNTTQLMSALKKAKSVLDDVQDYTITEQSVA